jgi:alkylhydroperoxidase family enzyme
MSEREAAAVAFAERLARDHTSIDDAFMTRKRSAFADGEIVELGFAIAGFLVWGRLHRAFGVPRSRGDYHALLKGAGGDEPRLRA